MRNLICWVLLLTAPLVHADSGLSTSISVHKDALKTKGLAFATAGGAAFATGLTMGVLSTDLLPSIAHGLVQTAGSLAFSVGLTYLLVGDETLHELQDAALDAEWIRERGAFMKKQPELEAALLDQRAARWLERETRRQRVRGWVALANSLGTGVNLAFSGNRSSTKYAALGFIAAISLAGGLADLLTTPKKEAYPGYRAGKLSLHPFLGPEEDSGNAMAGVAVRVRID
jgi:hypothetical protein